VLLIAVVATVLPVLALGTWSAFALTRSLTTALVATLYLLANLLLLVDLLDLILRVAFRRWHRQTAGARCPTSVPLNVGAFTPYQMSLHLRPYALLVSVHNAAEELDDFLDAFAPYRDHLWVIDDASTDDTWLRLQQSGVRCVRASTNHKKPGALKALLAHIPPEIATVVVLDPDVRILDQRRRQLPDLETVIFEFQQSRMAAATPRIVVRPTSWLARMQAFEYDLACAIGRKSLVDHSITSGIAVYRRDALERALDGHTLSVYAEDLQNALILLGRGERIYYDERLVVETEGKHTWGSWFSQRVGWSYGFLEVYTERFRDIPRCARGSWLYAYHFFVYMGLFGVPVQPLRLLTLGALALSTANGLDFLLGLDWIPDTSMTAPTVFLSAYVSYTVFALLASCYIAPGPREWLVHAPAIPVYFFYAAAQVLPATVGYLNWFLLQFGGGRLYRDHYAAESFVRNHRR